MKIRKILTAAVAIAMCLTLSFAVCSAQTVSADDAYELAQDFLKEYYYALYTLEDYDFTPYIAPQALLDFVNVRIQSSWSKESLIPNSQRLEFEFETELVSSEDLGDCLRLFVAVRSSWRYIDTDFRSGSGDGVYLLIADSGDGLKIYDWYIPHDLYLDGNRGKLVTISDKDFWYTSSEVSEILAKQKEGLEFYDEIHAQKDTDVEESYAQKDIDVEEAYAQKDIDVEEAYNLAEDFLKEYYYALDMIEDYDFTPYIAPQALLDYVNGSIEKTWYWDSLVKVTTKREEYEFETELVSSEDLGDCLRLFVAVRSSWRYADVDFRSGEGEGVYLLIADSGDGLKIYDWYIPYDPYLEATRGDLDTVSDKDFWYTSSEVASILESQKEWYENIPYRADDINTIYAGTDQILDGKPYTEPTSTSATLHSQNKSATVPWVENTVFTCFRKLKVYAVRSANRAFSV